MRYKLRQQSKYSLSCLTSPFYKNFFHFLCASCGKEAQKTINKCGVRLKIFLNYLATEHTGSNLHTQDRKHKSLNHWTIRGVPGVLLSGLNYSLSELNSSPLNRELSTQPVPRTSSTDIIPVLKMLFCITVRLRSKS